jgi:hypothetical protein
VVTKLPGGQFNVDGHMLTNDTFLTAYGKALLYIPLGIGLAVVLATRAIRNRSKKP